MRMLTMALVTGGALLAGSAGENAAWLPSAVTLTAHARQAADEGQMREIPPAPWSVADPADSLYRQAREALGRDDYVRAAALFRRIHDDFPKSEYAADSYYWEAFALYRRGGSEDLRRALAALDTQRRSFPRASTRGDADALRTRITGALAQGGSAVAAESVVTDADRAAVDCPDEDDDERIAALNALLQMDEERAVPILEKVLARRDECSVVLRRKAVFLLAQKEDEGTAQALLRVLNTDPDQEVREQAVFWLSQVHSDEAVDALEGIVMSSRDMEIREKAIFALSQQDGERSTAILRRFAGQNDAPSELREKAIFWLGQEGRGNSRFLMDLYRQLDDEELKEKVIFSVSQMRGDSSARWLMGIATDAKEPVEMRKKALFWVAQADGGMALDELFDLYGRMEEREMKEQLIFVYSQRHEAKAVDKLMEIARTEEDRELRKKAVFWLSQSRDPRVADFLLEVINQ